MRQCDAIRLKDIVVAFANGEAIQFCEYPYEKPQVWDDIVRLDFTDTREHYRIKPKLKKVKIGLFKTSSNTYYASLYFDGEECKKIEKTQFFIKWVGEVEVEDI